ALMEAFKGDKLNVAALGNQVPQLHLHHVVRYASDAAWPAPVWGRHPPQPYDEAGRAARVAAPRPRPPGNFAPAGETRRIFWGEEPMNGLGAWLGLSLPLTALAEDKAAPATYPVTSDAYSSETRSVSLKQLSDMGLATGTWNGSPKVQKDRQWYADNFY